MLGKGRVAAGITPGSSILNGRETVAVAGTAEPLATTSTPIISVTVKALAGNTGMVYVGNEDVDNSNGFVLDAGEPVSIDIDNLSKVYIDVDVAGEGVSWIALVK